MRKLIATTLLLLSSFAVSAATINKGDVVASPVPRPLMPEVFDAPMRVFDGNFNEKLTGETPFAGLVAADAIGNITFAGGNTLVRLDPMLQILQTTRLSEPAWSFAVSSSGDRTYLLGESGRLYVVRADGSLENFFALPDAAHEGNIDLAPNQCTLVYIDGAHHVRRFDVCNTTALPDIAPNATADYVRALAEGGFAALNGRAIQFYDGTGRLTYTFNLPTIFADGTP